MWTKPLRRVSGAELFKRDRRPPKERMLDHIRKAIAPLEHGMGYL